MYLRGACGLLAETTRALAFSRYVLMLRLDPVGFVMLLKKVRTKLFNIRIREQSKVQGKQRRCELSQFCLLLSDRHPDKSAKF